MKQMDSMFIQKNASGDIYHLCHTDNSREVISWHKFSELLPLTSYDAEDGVYWFKSTNWALAQPAHNAPKTNGDKKVVLVHHIDGQTETDADWLARQAELDDYRQTVDGSSYRGQ